MSGPKIDYVELERQRQSDLEDAWEEQLLLIKRATEELNKQKDAAFILIQQIDKKVREKLSIEELGQFDEMLYTLNHIVQTQSKYKAQISQLMNANPAEDPASIQKLAKAIKEDSEKLYQEYEQEIEPSLERAGRFLEEKSYFLEQMASAAKNSAKYEMNAISGMDYKFIEFIEETDIEKCLLHMENRMFLDIEKEAGKQIKKIYLEIEDLLNCGGVSRDERRNLWMFAKKIYDMSDREDNSFAAVLTEFYLKKTEILQNVEIFEDLYQEYYAQYVLYLEILNRHRSNPIEVMPKERHLFASIQDLDDEIKKIRMLSKQENEHNYIREQIDEVMRSLNYDLSEEIVFGNATAGRHMICKSQDGKSAVHVQVLENKQILMEIIGIKNQSKQDGTKDFNAEWDGNTPSEAEKKYLLERQGRFCEMHPLIVEELRKRGILMEAKIRRPVGEEYLKKMLRYSDENIEKQENFGIINRKQQERRRIGKQKQLYRVLK